MASGQPEVLFAMGMIYIANDLMKTREYKEHCSTKTEPDRSMTSGYPGVEEMRLKGSNFDCRRFGVTLKEHL